MQHAPGELAGARAQPQRVRRAAAAQVQVAVPESDVVAGLDLVVHRQRQRRRLGEHLQLDDGHLDLAGGQLRVLVAGRAAGHLADDLHAELVAQRVRIFLAEHHLDNTGTVAQVDEDDPAVVAPAGHPAGERHRRAGVRGAQASGIVGTDHGWQLLIVEQSSPAFCQGWPALPPGTRQAGTIRWWGGPANPTRPAAAPVNVAKCGPYRTGPSPRRRRRPCCWWPVGRSRRPGSPPGTTRSGTPSASWPGRTPPTPGSWYWRWCCSAAATWPSPPYCTRPDCPAASCSPSAGWPPSRWSPSPGRTVGGSLSHGIAATVAVLALVLWPAGSALRLPRGHDTEHPSRPEPPWAFRRAVGLSATVVLLALFGWCAFEVTSGSRTGLAERVTAVAVSLWPLLAVLSARRAHLAWAVGGAVRVGPTCRPSASYPRIRSGPRSGPLPRA